MTEKKLFREVALEKLSSPDELDNQLSIVSPIGWVALIAFIILIAGTLVWGFCGNISKRVNGEGIILYGNGITSLQINNTGKIFDLSVSEGETIEKGQVLARIAPTSEINEQIAQLNIELEALKKIPDDNFDLSSDLSYDVYSELLEYDRNIKAAQEAVKLKKAQLEDAKTEKKSTILQQQDIVYGLKKNVADTQLQLDTYRQNVDNKGQYDANEQQLISQLNSYKIQLEQEEKKLSYYNNSTVNTYQSEYNEAINDLNEAKSQFVEAKTLKIKDVEKKIEFLSDQLLGEESVIRSTVNGKVLELDYKAGDFVEGGTSFCKIVEEGETSSLKMVSLYVPVEDGRKIEVGMDVMINPTTVDKQEYGSIIGQVKSVAEYVSNTESMMQTLKNETLVQRLAGDNAPLEIIVELTRDPDTKSGLKWTTPNGAPVEVTDGTLCVGEIKISNYRPIDLVVPFIKNLLPSFN